MQKDSTGSLTAITTTPAAVSPMATPRSTGAMTAAGTFPTPGTNHRIQTNVVAAHYDAPRLSVAPASAVMAPPGLQTFSPRSSQDTTVTFTNTTGAPVTAVKLSIAVPEGWS